MKKWKVFIIASFLVTVIAAPVIFQPALAAFFEAGEDLTIKVPYNDDLYAAGCPVNIDQPISGDAVVAGCIVNVNADVKEDLIIAGGLLNLNANVGDDVRAGAGEITINSIIEDDLFVGGGTVNIGTGAVIKGDLVVGGGRVNMNGKVLGNLKMGTGMLMLNGPVAGEATVYGGTVSINNAIGGDSMIAVDDLTFSSKASFGGDLEYWTREGEMDLSSIIVTGEAKYNPDLSYKKHQKNFEMKLDKLDEVEWKGVGNSIWRAYMIFNILSAALLIFLFMIFTNKCFELTAKKLEKETLSSFLAALVYFIVTPVVSFVLFFTIIGVPLGVILLVIYGLALYLAKIITALVLAYWVAMKWKLKWGKVALFFFSLLIYVLLMSLWYIPFVGWLIKLIIVCLAFGAFLLHKAEIWKKIA